MSEQPVSVPAPPVVTVLVTHEPGDWLPETLGALAAQDYPALQHLVLVTGTEDDPGRRWILDQVATHLPSAVVRFLGGNPGYAAACNRVTDLVQGDGGFFCFMHDDVAPGPDAISRLAEEMWRSNAGLAGPKLVYWDDPRMIQSVGSAVDRFGVVLPVADEGEIDQEQHDSVQDVFCLSGAMLMARADLFRAVGGFEASLVSHGADLDLCWRVHAAAARVVIVPAAVARHRESMARTVEAADAHEAAEVRLDSDIAAEKERVRTVVSLTAASQMPVFVPQLVAHTLVRAVLLVVTGRVGAALVELRALASVAMSLPAVVERRARAAGTRAVSGAEVRSLQIRGSAHVTAWSRARARRAGIAQAGPVPVREGTPRGVVTLWVTLVALLVVGSRSLWVGGVAEVGQMVPVGANARDLLVSHTSGWWNAGFGQVSAAPTALVLWVVGAFVTLGDQEVFRTLAVVALPLVGWLGAWRLASVIGTRAARIAGTLGYAAAPLPYAAIASGRWGALLVYALLPWCAHLGRHLVGHVDLERVYLDAAGNRVVDTDRDLFVDVPAVQWRRRFAALSLVCAVLFAFEPGVVVVVPLMAVAFALVTWVHGAPFTRAMRWIVVVPAALAVGVLLNLPWAATYLRDGWWEALTGAPVENGRNLGLDGLATFSVGGFTLGAASLAIHAAVVGAILLVRGSRYPWALRGAMLAGSGLLLALLDDNAILPAHLPEPAVMLSVVALGVSMCAAAMGASLALDLRRGRISWRQPLGVLVAAAFAVGLVPPVVNAVDGAWNQPELSVAELLRQLPADGDGGGYRSLFVGDPRVLPGAPTNFGWGIAWSVVNGRAPRLDEAWEHVPTNATDAAEVAMYGIVRGQTARSGRLLAPLGVRYVIVPIVDGGESRRDSPIAAPKGLVEALSRQLDLRRLYSSPDLVIFENAAWVPTRAVLDEPGSQASRLAGAQSTIAADLSAATPALAVAGDPLRSVAGDLPAGTFHLSVPFTDRWRLEGPDGEPLEARPAFGTTTAFDVGSAGRHVLSFRADRLHGALVLIQFVAWCTLGWVATARRRPRRARRGATSNSPATAPALTMGAPAPASSAAAASTREPEA